jgi:hypothetical protein
VLSTAPKKQRDLGAVRQNHAIEEKTRQHHRVAKNIHRQIAKMIDR